jgi:mannose/fructose/N-acetylgalactosamine-specific phosphotransferase system component IIC
MEVYLLIAVLAGIAAMDTTSGPQFLFSEPIVTCPIIGYLLGMPETGLITGMFFQLLWLGYLPLGTVHFLDSNMAAFITTASLISAVKIFDLQGVYSSAAFILATLFGVIVGFIGMKATTFERKLNCNRFEKSLIEKPYGTQKFFQLHLTGIASSFIKGLLLFVFLVPIGTVLIGCVRFLPEFTPEKAAFTEALLWGIVPGSAILFYMSKGKGRYIAVGIIGGLLGMMI